MEMQDRDCCEYCGEPNKELIKTLVFIGERQFYEYLCKDCNKAVNITSREE
jgi:hypothetical protein